MDENFVKNLDREYEQFIEIIQPHLCQLKDRRMASICNAWIERLSACNGAEKVLRNRYIITLCYQLSKGILDEPFVKEPTHKGLLPIYDPTFSELSSSEILDSQDAGTTVLFSKKSSNTDTVDTVQDTEDLERKGIRLFDTRGINTLETNSTSPFKQTMYSYHCPETTVKNYKDIENVSEVYGYRTSNIISKLREIKKQNTLLHNELQEIKEKSSEDDCFGENANKVNTSTIYMRMRDSNSTLDSLKCKLKEVQGVRNALINKIQSMQDCIDNFNELKSQEIEELRAKHTLELINYRSNIKEETKQIFEEKLKEQKEEYETKIKDLQINNAKALEVVKASKDDIIAEKDKIIQQKEAEIVRMSEHMKDNKESLHSILRKLIDMHNVEQYEHFKMQNQILQKRIVKMEKAKIKCVRAYESKLASLQREKHLIECSLQIQLVRQRAQLVSDIAGDCQTETKKAVDKLEAKYQDIVANMQATAIQRRLEDQMAVGSILQAASGVQNDTYGFCLPGFPKNTPHLRRGNNQCERIDTEITSLFQGNKVYGKVVPSGNKGSRGENGRCGEHGTMFEKMCVPQRDTNDKAQM